MQDYLAQTNETEFNTNKIAHIIYYLGHDGYVFEPTFGLETNS